MFKKKSPLKNSRLVKRKKRIFYLKVVSGVFGTFIFIFALSYLSKIQPLLISDIKINGAATIESDVIKSVIHDHIDGNYWFLFSRANKWLYPKKAIAQDLSTRIQKIESLNLETDKQELVVDIKERAPAYTWCKGLPTPTGEHECYFIDAHGYIFADAPVFSGNVFFAFYGMVNSEKPIGSIFLPEDQFKQMGTLVEYLNTHNAKPYALLAQNNGVYEVYFEKGGKLIFKSSQDVNALISNVDLVLKNTKLFPKEQSQLEYIDMRFGNKIYYKLTGDNAVQPVE